MASVKFPATGPWTPAHLSARRLEREKQLKDKQLASQTLAQQQGAAAAAGAAGWANQRGKARSASLPGPSTSNTTAQAAVAARSAVVARAAAAAASSPGGTKSPAHAQVQTAQLVAQTQMLQQKSSQELVQIALHHLPTQEAQRHVAAIAQNQELTETDKVDKLSKLISYWPKGDAQQGTATLKSSAPPAAMHKGASSAIQRPAPSKDAHP